MTLAIVGSLAGCTKDSAQKTLTNSNDTTEGTSAYSLPITKEPITLNWWKRADPNRAAAGLTDEANSSYMKELQKRTGITLKFINPAVGQETTQFNLLIASGSLPDIITWDWMSYNGGPEKAITDNIIIDHKELISKYATNFNKFVKAHPEIEKEYKTDSGKMYNMPSFMTVTPEGKDHTGPVGRTPFNEPWQGPILRADWLKELGLSAPTTIDEWYNVLKAFKEKKNVTAPLTFDGVGKLKSSGSFIGAYGITNSFSQDKNKKIVFGPATPQYKEFLTTFSKWYKEGLIDLDFSTNDVKALNAKAMSDKSGAWLGAYSNQLGNYMVQVTKTNPNYDLIGVLNPTLNKGDKDIIGQMDFAYKSQDGVSITSSNKHSKESIQMLDYVYGDEGDMLINWGIEGTGYTMISGQPQFTDAIAKSPDGLPVTQALYKTSMWVGSFAEDYGLRLSIMKTYGTPRAKEAVDAWSKATLPVKLPPITIATDKSATFSKTMSDINTYVDEEFLKFVIGTEPLDKFDSYVAQLKKMEIDQAIQIQQEALDAYYKR